VEETAKCEDYYALFMTCARILEKSTRLSGRATAAVSNMVHITNGRMAFDGRVVNVDDDLDIGLVKVDLDASGKEALSGIKVLTFYPGLISDGDHVWVIGYDSTDKGNGINCGIVSAKKTDRADRFSSDVVVNAGYSGMFYLFDDKMMD